MAGCECTPPDRLALPVAEECSAPFRCWLIRDVLPGDLATNCWNAIPGPSWFGWDTVDMGARYSNDLERGKRTSRDLANLPKPISAALRYLNSSPFTEALCRTLGLNYFHPDPTLHGGGLHVTEPGGWLATHLDYSKHPILGDRERRLNLILFLNPVWEPSWGGAFEMADPLGNVLRRVYPKFNTACVFETGDLSYHGTQQTGEDAPERATLAVYYLSAARPGATRQRALFMPKRT